MQTRNVLALVSGGCGAIDGAVIGLIAGSTAIGVTVGIGAAVVAFLALAIMQAAD